MLSFTVFGKFKYKIRINKIARYHENNTIDIESIAFLFANEYIFSIIIPTTVLERFTLHVYAISYKNNTTF